jgi:two-component system cell cycle response regulator DivK
MSYKIFVVEDNILNLKLFTDLLTIRNYNVIQSSDGLGIVERTLKEKPDLIFMDIQIKNLSGIDLIRELKNNLKTKNIPVIAITAFTLLEDIEKIIDSGCDKYIAKPVSMDDFYKAIQKFLPYNINKD